MNALNAAQRMQMIEKFETLTMNEYKALNSEIEQLRQRVQELKKERDALLEANRIACEDLVERHDRIAELQKQRDELLAELQRFMDSHEECTDFDGFTAQIVSMADYHQAQEAIASVKEKA